MQRWLKETFATVKAAWAEVKENNVLDWAAALTYYGMLSLFPALIVLVSLIGLIGDSATNSLLDQMQGFAPGPAREIVESAIKGIQGAGASTGIFFVVGLVAAVWSTSGYVGAFGRASGSIWREDDDRPAWLAIATRVATTVVLLVLLALIGAMIVFSGPLADQLEKLLGVGDGISRAWSYVKWPLLLVLMAILLSLLYAAAAENERRRFRIITTGSFVAIVIWTAASLGFSFYVSNLSSYSKVYGSLAGVVVFLVWIWITNVAILLGVHIDAMRARAAAGDD